MKRLKFVLFLLLIIPVLINISPAMSQKKKAHAVVHKAIVQKSIFEQPLPYG